MFRHCHSAILFAAICTANICGIATAQTVIPTFRELRIPSESRGTFGGGFWAFSVPAHERFAIRLLPDQRLLVLNPNSNGQWTLTRIDRWWTDSPQIETLLIRGWTAANVRGEQDITTGLLVTSGGEYAVVLSGVEKAKDASHIPFAPEHSIAGKPDTLAVLVELARWRVVGAVHSAALGDMEFRRAQIVGEGRWIALEGYDRTPSPHEYAHVFERANQLISIPDLKPGPQCISTTSDSLVVDSHGHPEYAEVLERSLARGNNDKCAELLKAAGLTSVHRYEALMYLGEDPAPETYQPYKEVLRKFSTGSGSIDERNFNHDVMVGTEGGFTPEDDKLYHYNPPYQSRTGNWFEFQHPAETLSYQLAKYDHSGTTLSSKSTKLLTRGLCDQWVCDCRVGDVNEESGALLAYCHGFTVDFFDVHHEKSQWLTVFSASNLSEAGDIQLPKGRHTKQVLARVNGESYVLVVEQGNLLRVYRLPGAPNSRS